MMLLVLESLEFVASLSMILWQVIGLQTFQSMLVQIFFLLDSEDGRSSQEMASKGFTILLCKGWILLLGFRDLATELNVSIFDHMSFPIIP
jgi:hypothetical protein